VILLRRWENEQAEVNQRALRAQLNRLELSIGGNSLPNPTNSGQSPAYSAPSISPEDVQSCSGTIRKHCVLHPCILALHLGLILSIQFLTLLLILLLRRFQLQKPLASSQPLPNPLASAAPPPQSYFSINQYGQQPSASLNQPAIPQKPRYIARDLMISGLQPGMYQSHTQGATGYLPQPSSAGAPPIPSNPYSQPTAFQTQQPYHQPAAPNYCNSTSNSNSRKMATVIKLVVISNRRHSSKLVVISSSCSLPRTLCQISTLSSRWGLIKDSLLISTRASLHISLVQISFSNTLEEINFNSSQVSLKDIRVLENLICWIDFL